MKTTVFLLFSLAAVFTLALLYNVKSEKPVKFVNSRDEMFSSLVDDEMYRNEFMGAMKVRYPEFILTSAFSMTNDNKEMQAELINQMAAMCYSDPHMSKMMIGMTMNMCEIDKEMCTKMSRMMIHHEATMQCMLRMMQENELIDKACLESSLESLKTVREKIDDPENGTHHP